MATERFPADTPITPEDFHNCGWNAAVEGVDRDITYYYHRALGEAAKQAGEEGRFSHCRVLWLLSDAMSMMLSSANEPAPFKPLLVLQDGSRSTLPEDFSDDDLDFLAGIVDQQTDELIRARIGDLVWTRTRKYGPGPALAAIDAYTSSPISKDTWSVDTSHSWKRAIDLSRRLKAGAGDRLQKITQALLVAFDASQNGQAHYPLALARLLFDAEIDAATAERIADRLMAIARERFTANEHHAGRAYSDLAANTYKNLKNAAKGAEALVETAASWADEVDHRKEAGSLNGLLGVENFNKAIEVYRGIPRANRPPLNIDQRIADLEVRLTESGQQALGQMTAFRTPGVDVTDLRKAAQDAVAGLPLQEAMVTFVRDFGEGADVQRLKKSVEESLHGSLRGLFSTVVIGGDGRVVARQPGTGLNPGAGPGVDPAIQFEMVRAHMMRVGLTAQAEILPAMEVLLLEHPLSETDFIQIARECPIVPSDRVIMVGKALFAGYSHDFGTAVYLLAPQIEHIVRMLFKSQGVKTTHLKDGVENEVGLSSLLEKDEAAGILGENLKFELEALYCDPTGPNLRNTVAHGLLHDGAAFSPYTVYAWWYALRLILLTTLENHEPNEDAGDSAGEAGHSGSMTP